MNIALPLNIIIILFKIYVNCFYTFEYYNKIFAFIYNICLIFKWKTQIYIVIFFSK